MTSLQQMLLHQEGKRPDVYMDSVGKLTAGIGRNISDVPFSDDEIKLMFDNDLVRAFDAVHSNFSCYDQLSEARKMVLVSLAFNLGKVGLSKFVRFIGAVHLGKWEDAAAELLNSKAATQAPSRYQTLAKMMREDSEEWV